MRRDALLPPRPEGSRRWRYGALAAALVVIIAAAALAILVHVLLGLFEIKLAIAETSTEDRQAATALIGLFSAEHPRVRIKTVLEPDRLGTAAALDRGDTQLALIRSDAAPQDGQTLVITRRDAVVFVAPGGNAIDSVVKLRGQTVALLDGRKLDPRLLDLILTHYGVPPDSVRREVLTVDQLTEAARHHRIGAVFVVAPVAGKVWLALYAALRKGSGAPKTFEVDEAAAIAREHPVLGTIDLPEGALNGSIPSPSDDITTLSVSHRLVARSRMPDWLHAFVRTECEEAVMRGALGDAVPLYRDAPEAEEPRTAGTRAIQAFVWETHPNLPEAACRIAGDLVAMTLGAVGEGISAQPRTGEEVEAYAEGLADMLSAYLSRLATATR